MLVTKLTLMVMNLYNAFSILHIQMYFTRNRSEWNKAWPQHQEPHALLFMNSVCMGSFISHQFLCEQWRVVRQGRRFIVLNREDLKVSQSRVELQRQLLSYSGPPVLVRPESNSQPPIWQPDAQPTEPLVRNANLSIFFLTATLTTQCKVFLLIAGH